MGKEKVLIIDDDIDLCEGIAEFLQDEGFDVVFTTDPFQGEDLIDREPFDVLLLDFKMTGLTGVDILKRIRSRNVNIKIILVTGRPFIEKILQEENMTGLVNGIVGKPFDPDMLIEKIRSLCVK